MLEKNFTLPNGVEVPALALGTWQIDDATVEGVVRDALDIGYRRLDTAVQYENEAGIGRSIRESSIARNDVSVTTKLPTM